MAGPGQSPQALAETSRQLETVLDDFGVRGEIIDAKTGPVVTLYELEPAPGTRAARVISLADDIARSLCALSVRVAVVPGRNVIGIELPNERRATVYLRELLEADVYAGSGARLPLALGKDISGQPIIADLARMPHLLIAGTTGSGKSVAINAMILSLLYRLTPEQLRRDHDRPQGDRALGLRGHPAPAGARGHRPAQGGGGAEMGRAADGRALPADVASGRARHLRLQQAADAGARPRARS